MAYEYEALRVMIPSGHEHQSLVFVVGEPHPPESIEPDTRKSMGKITGFDEGDAGEWVRVNFEDGNITFNHVPFVRILIGKKK